MASHGAFMLLKLSNKVAAKIKAARIAWGFALSRSRTARACASRKHKRHKIVFLLCVFCAFLWLFSISSSAQDRSPVDLSGTWRWVNQEDATNRLSGVDPGGRYEGLPLNDAARMRADTYSEEWLSTSPLLQCRPRGPTY